MSRIHNVRYIVIARPDNLDGTSNDFDGIIGIGSDGLLLTGTGQGAPGMVLAHLDHDYSNPSADRITLYEVMTPGQPLNMVDEQPQPGDLVVCTCPMSEIPFQAGLALTVTADGSVTNFAANTSAGMFPILAGDWMASASAILQQMVQQALQQALPGNPPPAPAPPAE